MISDILIFLSLFLMLPFAGMASERVISLKAVMDSTGVLRGARQVMGMFRNVQAGARNAAGQIRAVTASTNAFRVALMATGIGAVVAALGALIQAFRSTQEGADRINRVLVPLQSIFQALWGVVQNLSVALADRLVAAFRDPRQAIVDLGQALLANIINRFRAVIDIGGALGRVIQGIFTRDFAMVREGARDAGNAFVQLGTGVEDAGDKLLSFGRDINTASREAFEAGQQIQALTEEIEKLRVEQEVPLARMRREYEELRNVVRDTAASEEQRLEAADRAVQIRRDITDEELRLLDLEIERLELQQSLNDTTREEELELQRLIARREELQATTERELGRVLSQRSSVIRQIEAQQTEEEKARQAEIQAMEERAEAFRELLLTEEELRRQAFERELAGLEELVEEGMFTREEALEIRREMEQEFLAERTEGEAAAAGSILAIEKELAEARMAFRRAVTDEERELHAEEMRSIQERLEAITAAAEGEKEVRGDSISEAVAGQVRYNRSVRENANSAIDALLAEAVMAQIRNVISSVPFPFNLFLTAGAAAGVKGLRSLVPEFLHGGLTSPGRKLISVNEDDRPEFVVNAESTRRALPLLHRVNADPSFAEQVNRAMRSGFADGGLTSGASRTPPPPVPSGGVDTAALAQAIREGMAGVVVEAHIGTSKLSRRQREHDQVQKIMRG